MLINLWGPLIRYMQYYFLTKSEVPVQSFWGTYIRGTILWKRLLKTQNTT